MVRTRRHSCGETLDLIERYEVIPVGAFQLACSGFVDAPETEDLDLVYDEYRCSYCGESLAKKDQEWVRSLLPEDN